MEIRAYAVWKRNFIDQPIEINVQLINESRLRYYINSHGGIIHLPHPPFLAQESINECYNAQTFQVPEKFIKDIIATYHADIAQFAKLTQTLTLERIASIFKKIDDLARAPTSLLREDIGRSVREEFKSLVDSQHEDFQVSTSDTLHLVEQLHERLRNELIIPPIMVN